jgi:predicted outer membrane protein
MRNTIIGLMLATGLVVVPAFAHHGTAFLNKAMEMNMAEVRMAELAATKTDSDQVKQYAQMLIKDHNQALDKIKELRDARLAETAAKSNTLDERTLKNAADVPLTAQHQKTMEHLATLSGAAFDNEFMNIMLREHRDAIHDFEAQTRVHGNEATDKSPAAPNATRQKPGDQKYSHVDLTKDQDTADFARETLPTLRQHLERGEMIQAGLKR